MAIYELQEDRLIRLKETAFKDEGIRERDDLQRILREQVDIISPDTMVIAEEFGDWEDSKRRIDLFGLDADANLVVIELKRTETGGHMELQAIRYAAMVSTMTFQQIVNAHEQYLKRLGKTETNAEEEILAFLGWDQPDENEFAKDVRIVLASAEFSREITSTVMWLNERGLDIRCVRLLPYKMNDRMLVDVQQLIPLPEAEEYQVKIREKSEQKREARQSRRDNTKYALTIADSTFRNLSKRELAYRVAIEAIRRGITPDQLCDVIAWKGSRLWTYVDGEVNEDLFIEKAESRQGSFDSRRFFTADDKLIRFDGKTYAFTNQWGTSTLEAVDKVIAFIQASDITYEPMV